MSISIETISLNDERVAFVEARPEGWAGYVKVDEFHKALKEQGIPEKLWPSKPTPAKRLERAMKAQRDSRRVLIRPLPRSRGWSLVTEDEVGLELEGDEQHKTAHSVDLTCVVKYVNNTAYVDATPWDHPRAQSVKEEFSKFENIFKCSEDLSQWFSQKIIPWCRGVATRSRGGAYYIMKGEYLSRVIKISNALEKVSYSDQKIISIGDKTVGINRVHVGGRIILKPEVASETAVEILLDNFIQECEQIAANINDRVTKGSLGHRALTSQKDLATDQIDKLGDFEGVLGTKLTDLRNSLTKAKDGAGMAALAALAAKEQADG